METIQNERHLHAPDHPNFHFAKSRSDYGGWGYSTSPLSVNLFWRYVNEELEKCDLPEYNKNYIRGLFAYKGLYIRIDKLTYAVRWCIKNEREFLIKEAEREAQTKKLRTQEEINRKYAKKAEWTKAIDELIVFPLVLLAITFVWGLLVESCLAARWLGLGGLILSVVCLIIAL